jgi:hypothetical protein
LVLPVAGLTAVQSREEIKRQIIAGRKVVRSGIGVFMPRNFITESDSFSRGIARPSSKIFKNAL